MILKRFNEGVNDSEEFEKVMTESLTFITDNFNYNNIQFWDKSKYLYSSININFENYTSKSFEDEVNSIQTPIDNYKIYEERARFWKEVYKMKNHLDSIFDEVVIYGDDLRDNEHNKIFELIIKCKNDKLL